MVVVETVAMTSWPAPMQVVTQEHSLSFVEISTKTGDATTEQSKDAARDRTPAQPCSACRKGSVIAMMLNCTILYLIW